MKIDKDILAEIEKEITYAFCKYGVQNLDIKDWKSNMYRKLDTTYFKVSPCQLINKTCHENICDILAIVVMGIRALQEYKLLLKASIPCRDNYIKTCINCKNFKEK